MKMDLSAVSGATKQFEDAKKVLAAIPGKVEAAKKKKDELLKEMKEKFKGSFDPKLLAKVPGGGVDLDEVFAAYEEKPADPWRLSGMRFVEGCRDEMASAAEIVGSLRSLGLRPYTLKRSWIGINRQEVSLERVAWGLKGEAKAGDPRMLVIPAGLVIPRFNGPDLDRITVRPIFGEAPARIPEASVGMSGDIVVEGSQDVAMVLGGGEGKPFVRVADDLEAILLHQELGDFCAVVAMKDPSIAPDKETKAALEKAPQFLVVTYPGEMGDTGAVDLALWKKLCPEAGALALPAGRNLFEAKKEGADLWQWVADALKPGVAPAPEEKPRDVDVMEPGALAALIPKIDVKAIYKKVEHELKAKIQPKLDLLALKKAEGLALIRKEAGKKGFNIDEIMKNTPPLFPKGANPYKSAQEKYAQNFAKVRQALVTQGTMNAEIDAKLAEAEGQAQKILADSAKLYDDGKARLAAMDAKVKAGPPDWAKKLLAKAGIDPDDPEPAKPLTREEVIDRHQRGLSLAGKNMAGVDLSGLDLTGADMRQANLQKTNLTGSNLDGADLTRSMAGEADLTGASLKGAKLMKAIFQKAKLPGADLTRADMTQSMMSEADFTKADMTGAVIVKTLLEKAVLKDVRAVEASASETYLLSADISGADFSGADLTKAVFLKTRLDGANLSRSKARQASFLEAKGEKVNFSGADMHNSRILQGSAITESDFTNTRADRASWMKSDLSGGDFRGSTIERALLQECDLTGTNFSGVTAKQARLTKSNMSDSNLKEINLFQGSLRKSKLVRTDLTGANLYGAEFYRTGVGETKLDDANLKMTKLHKRADLLPEPPKEKKK
jgi:uncharacterized protein YjbI with pentapeptide repeats